MKIDFPLNFIKTFSIAETKNLLNKTLSNENRYILITGKTKSRDISENLFLGLSNSPFAKYSIDNNEQQEIEKLYKEVINNSIKCIVAVGGGVVNDFAKRLAFLSTVSLITVPTIISNDGMASPISVITIDNKKISLPASLPKTIIACVDIIKDAPKFYLDAAILDILSNISALNDWNLVEKNSDMDSSISISKNLSNMAVKMIMNLNLKDIPLIELIDCALDVQLLSGMAMTIAGSSRPCSGSEHLISHALDELGIASETLHGKKVGTISEFTLFLQNKDNVGLKNLLRTMNIKPQIPGFASIDENLKIRVFETAKIIRPDRSTILDNFTADELLVLYYKFMKRENK